MENRSALSRFAKLLIPALILNFLLFVPQFLVYREMHKHLPDAVFDEYVTYPVLSFFLIRDHFDIFRFNCDFLVLLLITSFMVHRSRSVRWTSIGATVIYLFLMLYSVYYEVLMRLYHGHPYFKNDIALLKGVLPTFLKEIGWGEMYHYGLFFLLIIVVGALIYLVWKYLLIALLNLRNSRKITIMTGVTIPFFIGGIVSENLYKSEGYKQSWKTIQWISPKIWKSTKLPHTSEKSSLENLSIYESYKHLKLTNRPNIFCIFMESYGAVAFHSIHGERHKAFLTTVDSELKSKGWSSASTYSKAPIVGGRSWLSFTSALSGIHIESQIQFNHLLEYYSDYPHLVRWLKHQGYQTFRMKTMSNVKQSTPRLYRLSEEYFDFDYWMKHEDITYKGYKYDEYYGGIPDQYAMYQFYEDHSERLEQPYFLFFITMSTHIPWHPPAPILEDWKELNKLKDKPDDFDLQYAQPKIDRYHATIEYSWSVMQKFVLDNLQQDSTCIFIVIGDHQPPKLDYLLEGKKDPFTVPVHILSQDTAIINAFQSLGFDSGLLPDETIDVTLKHEAFYSMMVNRLLNVHGQVSQDSLPPVLMDGL